MFLRFYDDSCQCVFNCRLLQEPGPSFTIDACSSRQQHQRPLPIQSNHVAILITHSYHCHASRFRQGAVVVGCFAHESHRRPLAATAANYISCKALSCPPRYAHSPKLSSCSSHPAVADEAGGWQRRRRCTAGDTKGKGPRCELRWHPLTQPPLQALQHSIFQSLPKTPHIGVRGSAKAVHSALTASQARPSSPSHSHVHQIPCLTTLSRHASPHRHFSELPPHQSPRSPRQGGAAIARSRQRWGGDKGRLEGSGRGDASSSNESRDCSPKPAAALGSKHAHSILQMCLNRGPSPEPGPPSPADSSFVEPTHGGGAAGAGRLPLGLASPSMSSNEMQVFGGPGKAFVIAFLTNALIAAHSSALVRGC